MIVVIEGIDRVGKTTLAKKFEKAGFIYLKDEFLINPGTISNFADYSVGKCDSFVVLAKELEKQGKNVVIDRLHMTELVYGEVNRKSANVSGCLRLDMELANMGAFLFLVYPTDISLSNEMAGVEQNKLQKTFEFYSKLTSMQTIICNYDNLDEVFDNFVEHAFTYDFYFASPFFNPEQVEREERMIKHLRSMGYKVFSPKEACHLDAKASFESRENVFKENCDSIKKSKAVFAVTDGKDIGTIWETGYAYGVGTPIIYFAETLGNNKFNVMLAQSGIDVFTSQEEVTREALDCALHGNKRKFRGDIE